MSRLDTSPPILSLAPASFAGLDPARRLIVLIPDAEVDYTPAVRYIWKLAKAQGGRVQFLGLYREMADEPRLRRQLVTLAALVQDNKVSVETRIETGSNWVSALRSDLRDGDMIVCFAEQRVGLTQRPLSQILESNLDAPVYILPDFHPQRRPRSNWICQTIAWMGSIGIILGFFWVQVKIDQASSNWLGIVMLMLSVLVEVWLLWSWNSLVG